MKSQTSLIAKQVRLQQWAEQVKSCWSRSYGMKVDTWCSQKVVSYTYMVNNGPLKKITYGNGSTVEYGYDVLGRVITEKRDGMLKCRYVYSSEGDLSRKEEVDSSGKVIKENNNGTETTKTFSYTDSDWKDLLTAVDGHSFTYDDCGNPLTYYNGKDWTFTWKEGRRLAAAKSGTTSVSYTYDAEGMRTSKTIDGVKHNYVYLGDLLVEETWGNNTLRFSYDEQNRPYSVQYNSNLYYYVLNQQGDVIRLVNGDGVIRGEYTYDAWGNILKVTATAEIGNVNPLRYRGYVYDSETGFYYVGSRYYDAENCRFISADDTELLTTTMDDITDKNLYAYCDNDPINRVDEKGDIWKRYVLVRFIPLNPPVFIAACVVYVGLSYLARKYVKARKNGFSITGWIRANARRPKLSKGGKQNYRDSGLIHEKDEEINKRLKKKNIPKKEKKRLEKEQKARKNRNKQKRENYNKSK